MSRLSKIIVFIFLLFLIPTASWAACTGASPTWACTSWADLEALVEGVAVVDGDTINVAAGTYTSSTTITTQVDKSVKIIGAGYATTTINLSALAFYIRSDCKVSKFTFSTNASLPAIEVTGINWRVDHNWYTNTNYTIQGAFVNLVGAPYTFPWNYGLVDNNRIISGKVQTALWTSSWTAQALAWYRATNLGSALNANGDYYDVTYIEDNEFGIGPWDSPIADSGNCVDSNNGGGYVFRYNDVQQAYAEAHSYGSTPACGRRGTRKWEIYGNTFAKYESAWSKAASLRGGTGVAWGNDFTSTVPYNYDIAFDNVRSYYDVGTPCNKCDNVDETYDGQDDATGWLCRDQIGAGIDASQWVYPPADNLPAPDQANDPAYVWNNTNDSANSPAEVVDAESQAHIVADRDFYDYDAAFDGSSGVGVGNAAAMAAIDKPGAGICTAGVGYWVTDEGSWNNKIGGDQGRLYTCDVGDAGWTLTYTPFTYPHPLTSGTAVPSGTVVVEGGLVEGDIVTGSKTLVITLTNDTWVATAGDNNAITTAIIAGIDSDGVEGTGWDAVVKANMVHGDITREVDNVTLTIILAAEATYNITASETITVTIPTTAVASAVEIVATPTFVISVDTSPAVQTMTGVYDSTGHTGTYDSTGHTTTP